MLEITTKKRRWPAILALIIFLVILAIGGYVAITVLSPSMPVLSGKAQNATAQKLTQPAHAGDDRLYIPQLNVDLAIKTGADSRALDQGAWYKNPENGNPVDGGNFVLSARRYVIGFTPQETAAKSPFYNLRKLAKGDKLYVDFHEKRFQYEITKNHSVDTKDIEIATDEPQLTLYARTSEGTPIGQTVIEARLLGQASE